MNVPQPVLPLQIRSRWMGITCTVDAFLVNLLNSGTVTWPGNLLHPSWIRRAHPSRSAFEFFTFESCSSDFPCSHAEAPASITVLGCRGLRQAPSLSSRTQPPSQLNLHKMGIDTSNSTHTDHTSLLHRSCSQLVARVVATNP